MPHICDEIYDQGLQYLIDNANRIYLDDVDPGLDYNNLMSSSGYTYLDSLTFSAITSESDGSFVIITTDELILAKGFSTVSYYAIVDYNQSKILASGDIASSYATQNTNDKTAVNSIKVKLRKS